VKTPVVIASGQHDLHRHHVQEAKDDHRTARRIDQVGSSGAAAIRKGAPRSVAKQKVEGRQPLERPLTRMSQPIGLIRRERQWLVFPDRLLSELRTPLFYRLDLTRHFLLRIHSFLSY